MKENVNLVQLSLIGGQTTVASVRKPKLQFTNIYQEGGEYVTKDISKVLKLLKTCRKRSLTMAHIRTC